MGTPIRCFVKEYKYSDELTEALNRRKPRSLTEARRYSGFTRSSDSSTSSSTRSSFDSGPYRSTQDENDYTCWMYVIFLKNDHWTMRIYNQYDVAMGDTIWCCANCIYTLASTPVTSQEPLQNQYPPARCQDWEYPPSRNSPDRNASDEESSEN